MGFELHRSHAARVLILRSAAALRIDASLDDRLRLQEVLFPQGLDWDGKGFPPRLRACPSITFIVHRSQNAAGRQIVRSYGLRLEKSALRSCSLSQIPRSITWKSELERNCRSKMPSPDQSGQNGQLPGSGKSVRSPPSPVPTGTRNVTIVRATLLVSFLSKWL